MDGVSDRSNDNNMVNNVNERIGLQDESRFFKIAALRRVSTSYKCSGAMPFHVPVILLDHFM